VVVDTALLVAWLAILAVVVVRYRRGGLTDRRLLLLGGAGCAWSAYSLLQLTEAGPVTAPLESVLVGGAVLLLVAGSYALYRGWRLSTEQGGAVESG
jgi:uncharacterized membrane protein